MQCDHGVKWVEMLAYLHSVWTCTHSPHYFTISTVSGTNNTQNSHKHTQQQCPKSKSSFLSHPNCNLFTPIAEQTQSSKIEIFKSAGQSGSKIILLCTMCANKQPDKNIHNFMSTGSSRHLGRSVILDITALGCKAQYHRPAPANTHSYVAQSSVQFNLCCGHYTSTTLSSVQRQVADCPSEIFVYLFGCR